MNPSPDDATLSYDRMLPLHCLYAGRKSGMLAD